MGQKKFHPPRFAERLLSWYCKPSLHEDLSGDLEECFQRNIIERGIFAARFIYFLDVIKFCRPYTVRKLNLLNTLTKPSMLSSYIKTSGRSLARNKLFSAINIIGLAISLSVGLLMISMILDLTSFDKFNKQYDKIYRLKSLHQNKSETTSTPQPFASSSLKAGFDLQRVVPKSTVAILNNGVGGDVKAGTKTVELNGFYSNENIFSVFSFPVKQGNPATALKDPYTAVLTETSALKLFGEGDVMGKSIVLSDEKEYVVTAVIKDLPYFSHIKFDYLVSLASREDVQTANLAKLEWEDMWNNYVYFILPENTTPKAFQSELDAIALEENKAVKEATVNLTLTPLREIAIGDDLNNSIGPVMTPGTIWILIVLSAVVILSACFNYTNLSIAKSLRRSREVGIRKVIGAGKNNVLLQFVVEAIVISLLALMFAFIIFLLIKPFFIEVNQTLSSMLKLDISLKVIGGFLALGVATGILAGLFPAIFFTRINAVQVLKSSAPVKGLGGIAMRKVLIVLQYSLSLMLIAATIIGYRQYLHYVKFDLGFSTANILNIKLHHVKPDLMMKDLAELPEVKALSRSTMITSVGNYWGLTFKNIDTQDSTGVFYNNVDENYIPLHGHRLVSGRNFSAKASEGINDEVIIDEATLKHFKLAGNDPQKVLGLTVMVGNKPMHVIGVMKTYSYGRADGNNNLRVIFRYTSSDAYYINAKINTTDWTETLAKINAIWKKHDDVHPLQATLYDDQIAKTYGDISSMLKIVGFLSFLAIFIASLGMLGMIVLTTETRLKEISIRKVLGATEANLIFILAKSFIILLAISALIGLPAATLFFEKIISTSTSNRVSIQPTDFVLVVVSVLGLALLMIGMQTMKAARANPASVLKNE